ncbi:NUDIX hydrolase [Sporolactobacillus terrae]|uniref:NUDIX domain-containing protein n=1 Tax=Sporolactobacillus terrae TaxID=269673 RepID=A0ABX5Q7Q6_9BACL|nr:NUDIX domain-containing protein [Sporolactobacillus terrae]QAA22668.1 NUDIX domain-containing protein [Sporolactobacillus terrae]QAA25641.1 NUDIX domain-containing protein [Sporolactobacillus terrae]UAK17451.1 NUDIX domain-containing protein [Sporolactobacillus terrae]
MGYIQKLREMIGHQPLILVGSVVLIADHQNRLLLQKRNYPKESWGLPGGLMELGESAEETAVREVKEETGLTVSGLKLFNIYSGVRTPAVAENGDQYYPVTIAYKAQSFEGKWLIDPNESETFEFRSKDELPSTLLKNQLKIIEDYFSADEKQ